MLLICAHKYCHSRQELPNFSTMTTPRLKLAAAGALAAGSATTHAAIIVFDTNDRVYNITAYGNTFFFGDINLQTATYGFGSTNSPNFSFFAGSYYNEFQLQGSGLVSGINFTKGSVNNLFISAGATVASGANFYNTVNSTLGSVSIGTHYMGMRLRQNGQEHYGWLEFTRTSSSQILINQFAFNGVAGQSILAGQTTAVPEASTLGFAGGLFGLVVAAHLRRRQQKQAAASDKFLSLAAGEKLN